MSSLRGASDRLCYAMWLLPPFLSALSDREDVGPTLKALTIQDLDDRIPIKVVHYVLETTVEQFGEVDLGLKAARRLRLGDAGVVDYLVSSTENVEQALHVATRYMRLLNEALQVEVQIQGDRAIVRFDSAVPMPRPAIDFMLGGFYRTHLRNSLSESLTDLQVLIPYDRPADTTEHEATFAPARLCFGSPIAGFAFAKHLLQAPLAKADSRLYHVLRKQAEQALDDLPKAQSLTRQVRRLVASELSGGNPTAQHIAARLGISASTLGRRLEREGTTFKELVDALRKQLALQYLENDDIELSEVALLLGFSQSPAFHRAFRRWTGKTPNEYRRQHRL